MNKNIMVKYGDNNPEVTEVQKLLSLLGYDLIIDGGFGDKTLRSLQAFQKKIGLMVDGIAGSKTIEALKASQKRTAKEEKAVPAIKPYDELVVNRTCELDSSQYLKQTIKKDKIFIHFTAGGPSAQNVIKFWGSDETKVSTAYVIDGYKGEIFECFHPDFWSFHLGIKGTNGALDKTSIGIEICMWGPITKVGDKFMTYVNKEIDASEVYELNTPFRGYKYFHRISDSQLESLEKILNFLIDHYEIPVQSNFDNTWFDYKPALLTNKNAGLWTHVNVRKDKTDMYPEPKLIDLLNRLSIKYNS